MRNKWYGDNRDLVKWAALLHIAETHKADRILQIAYFRDDDFDGIEIDGTLRQISLEVRAHFRDIRKIQELPAKVAISVFDTVFKDRREYLKQTKDFIASFPGERLVVFLDPDTGLEPSKPSLKHVLDSEIKELWENLKPSDVLALYQHQTNRNGEPWLEPKMIQFEGALQTAEGVVKVARGSELARDVVLLYAHKA
jgi:hypothetical protein